MNLKLNEATLSCVNSKYDNETESDVLEEFNDRSCKSIVVVMSLINHLKGSNVPVENKFLMVKR